MGADLVAKQDLWWGARGEAERHYQEGDYGTALADVQASRGLSGFRHEFAFASLVISNLRDGQDELLWKNAEGYDHPLQIKSLLGLFETMAALRKWEEAA